MSLQYGVKEVLELQFLDYATGTPKLFIDYATLSENSVAGERVMVTGGQGNYRLMAFDHSKTSELKVTVPLVDLNLLAAISGDTVATGAQNVFKREVLTVNGSGTATLSQTPLAGTTPSVYYLNGTRDNGASLSKVASAPTSGQFSITGTTITVNSSDNNKQIVVWYQFATPSSSSKFSIKANKFAGSFKVIGTGIARDQITDTDCVTNITFYKAKPQQNFTITMSSTDVTKLELTFDLFAEKIGTDYVYSDYVFLT